MGAPKKPMAKRKLEGTANRNKHRNTPNQAETFGGIGEAPDYFIKEQTECWDYLVSCMWPGLLGRTDRPTFELMTMLFWRFRFGTYVEGGIPALSGVELSRLDSLMARYGMTPSDRTKISLPKGEKVNPFKALG